MARPLFGPLLFDNNDSDARDHCANERSMTSLFFGKKTVRNLGVWLCANMTYPAFLSWLRLSIYMAIVSVAIVISFHLKNQPTAIERRIAFPLGLIFWLLALVCLASGLANYIRTVARYSRRQALVQSGWKTEIVRNRPRSWSRSLPLMLQQVFTIVASSIVAACVLFLSTNSVQRR